jgi:hypothetical protein
VLIALTIVVLAALALVAVLLAIRVGPAVGVDTSGLGKRLLRPGRRGWALAMVLIIAALCFAAWAITDHHTALGVGTMMVVFVLSPCVLIPLHIRRDRKRVSDAQARSSSVERP